jgi:hypothetical protein
MNPFTGKCSKISLSILALFLASLLLSSTIVVQQSIASTNGEDQEQDDQEQEEQEDENKDQEQEQDDQEREQEEDNQNEQPEDDVKLIDPPEAETRGGPLQRGDVSRPSLSDAMPPTQTSPEATIDPGIEKPDPAGPLLPVPSPEPQESVLPQTEVAPSPTPDSLTTPVPTAVPSRGLSENCADKADELYLSPNDPCIDPLLLLCDAETPEDNPFICWDDPRDNPQGDRCVNEGGQLIGNVRECFPQREDILRELCGPQWDPGEECLIYGDEKTVLYGAKKVVIGPRPSGSPGHGTVLCIAQAPEGLDCIRDAPFAPGKGCDSLPEDVRTACENTKISGFEQMRYKAQFHAAVTQLWQQQQEQEKEKQERELKRILDGFKRFLDSQGITDPCENLSREECDQWLLDQDQCAQGNPLCDKWFEWREAYERYLRDHPDACAGLSPEACERMLLGIEHCPSNPLCADPSYRPNLQRATQGPLEPSPRPCTPDNPVGCYDDTGSLNDPPKPNERINEFQFKPTLVDKILKWVFDFGEEKLREAPYKVGGQLILKPLIGATPARAVTTLLTSSDTSGDSSFLNYCIRNPNDWKCKPTGSSIDAYVPGDCTFITLSCRQLPVTTLPSYVCDFVTGTCYPSDQPPPTPPPPPPPPPICHGEAVTDPRCW